ncbi:MAG: Hsp20 family protein, partial [Oscillospiraceae bacterium]|nr:Hsp20 family protein [Oscillospiraceae bacterium]
MFVPEIFRRNDFDELFEHPFDRAFGGMQRPQMPAMRTDVKETETGYELAIDLPGVKKENVQAQLHDGVLTVSATTQSEAED